MTRSGTAARDDRDAVDEDALAAAYEAGLAAERSGDLDGAVCHFREALRLDPSDPGGVSVRLAAIGRGAVPERAPPAYVATLFDQHADVFDEILLERLGYGIPLRARAALEAAGAGRIPRCLDLGCGTGLAGEAVRDLVDHLVGVDLSEGMIAVADDKEVYDALHVGDAEAFLAAGDDGPAFEAIIATDVLPYLGVLDRFVALVAGRLAAGGLFVASTEWLPEDALAGMPFAVGPRHRFAHDPGRLARLLSAHGLTPLAVDPVIVRYDTGEPVHGHLLTARREPPAG